ncbi:hypothetical protein JCM6882_003535 [Rhodosporidiobolus microsporus]
MQYGEMNSSVERTLAPSWPDSAAAPPPPPPALHQGEQHSSLPNRRPSIAIVPPSPRRPHFPSAATNPNIVRTTPVPSVTSLPTQTIPKREQTSHDTSNLLPRPPSSSSAAHLASPPSTSPPQCFPSSVWDPTGTATAGHSVRERLAATWRPKARSVAQMERDLVRTKELEAQGWRVVKKEDCSDVLKPELLGLQQKEESRCPPVTVKQEEDDGVGETVKSTKPRKAQSLSSKAGLNFPVGRTHRRLRRNVETQDATPGAAIYLTAVMEYLIAEAVELAGNAARDSSKSRITPHHVRHAFCHDVELFTLLTILAKGGYGLGADSAALEGVS